MLLENVTEQEATGERREIREGRREEAGKRGDEEEERENKLRGNEISK